MGLNEGFGCTPKGLKMDMENIPKVEERPKWFNEGWIMTVICSWGLILSIGANCVSVSQSVSEWVSQSPNGNNEADYGWSA